MIALKIVVESAEIRAESIARRLSMDPSGARLARPSRVRPIPGAPVHRWSLDLPIRAFHAGGEEGISAVLVALGEDVADRLGGLAADGCDVMVMVVQRVIDPLSDPGSVGIALTADAVAWMARAGAALVIDQYLD